VVSVYNKSEGTPFDTTSYEGNWFNYAYDSASKIISISITSSEYITFDQSWMKMYADVNPILQGVSHIWLEAPSQD
jgi:hypothetical protein